MITVEDREKFRRAYFIEKKTLRQIARESRCSRKTIKKALGSAEGEAYNLKDPRPAPVVGPYRSMIERLLVESERMPRKQRYTGHKIFEVLRAEGYRGSEPSVRRCIAQYRKEKHRREVYLPLEFDAGADAQVDWGEGVAILGGERITAQLFLMRLCYSRRTFMMAFPGQKQEAFFEGHVRAFHYFQGAPHRIAYDNLKTAVLRILQGHTRQEQQAFIVFRSHYLFESHFVPLARATRREGSSTVWASTGETSWRPSPTWPPSKSSMPICWPSAWLMIRGRSPASPPPLARPGGSSSLG